ncbi:MAG: pseudaminic acid synthase [Deltaproteobacteria bacterium]|nr:pseudaminic acid synthase [Deltaproteobacteria bacterium]
MHEGMSVYIAGHAIGTDHPPLIVAEMSGNHNGSLERALSIVDTAAAAGAHALKLQTYTADTMTIDHDGDGFVITDTDSLWHGYSLYRLYEEAHTPWEWHEELFARCRERGIVCFSTPFDATAVDFLEGLDCPAYKIASFENVDLPLIRKTAATGKPVVMSTGMATVDELEEAVQVARDAGCRDLVLLKCTSSYPADPSDSDLRTIPDLARRFDCLAGLSDHTLGIGAACASVAFGAAMIEKHFTLSRTDGGVDVAFSLEPDELRVLVEETGRAWRALGTVSYKRSAAEERSLAFRRSLYVVKDIRVGEQFSESNVRAIRPGYGLAPKYLDAVLGKRATQDVMRGTPLSWDLLD